MSPTFSCYSILTMTQSEWGWQQKNRIQRDLHQRRSWIVVIEDFMVLRAIAGHARRACLAQPELMALHQARRMATAEIAWDRVVGIGGIVAFERAGPAATGCRIQRGERLSEMGDHQVACFLRGLEGVRFRLWELAQKLAVGSIAEFEA